MISSSHVYVFGAFFRASNSSAPIGPTTPARPCLVRHFQNPQPATPPVEGNSPWSNGGVSLGNCAGLPQLNVDAGPPDHEWVDLLTSRGFPNQKGI